jgi:hypothetical protein
MLTTEPAPQKPPQSVTARAVSPFGKLSYLALRFAILVLALTGIGTFALGKAPMTGWVLMLHVAIAPLFALALAVLSVTWADAARFGAAGSPQSNVSKTLLWLILLCGVVVILSAVIPMTPLFGSGGQRALYLTHRYTSIALVVALALHVLSSPRNR